MDNQFKCQMCSMQFNSEAELNQHAQQAHSKPEENKEEHAIMCSKCGVKMPSQEGMQTHVQEAHKM